MTYVIEEWKPVVGYEGFYEVSNIGRVKRAKGGQGARAGHIRSPGIDVDGRLFVPLYKENKQKPYRIHCLVAEAFICVRPTGYEVNHIDGDKRNNRAENLEYVTPSQNKRHAVKNRLISHGENHCHAILSEVDVREIRALANYFTHSDIGKLYGVNRSTVTLVINRKNWRHVA